MVGVINIQFTAHNLVKGSGSTSYLNSTIPLMRSFLEEGLDPKHPILSIVNLIFVLLYSNLFDPHYQRFDNDYSTVTKVILAIQFQEKYHKNLH